VEEREQREREEEEARLRRLEQAQARRAETHAIVAEEVRRDLEAENSSTLGASLCERFCTSCF